MVCVQGDNSLVILSNIYLCRRLVDYLNESQLVLDLEVVIFSIHAKTSTRVQAVTAEASLGRIMSYATYHYPLPFHSPFPNRGFFLFDATDDLQLRNKVAKVQG